MNIEARKIYLEVKPYIKLNEETYETYVDENAPEKIKEKFKLYKNSTDEIVVDDAADLDSIFEDDDTTL